MNSNLKYYPISEIKNKKVYGRTVDVKDVLPLFWNNSGVEFNVTGTEFWLDLEIGNGFHEPWVALELNDALMSRRMMLSEDNKFCCFRSMSPDAVKKVHFFRELQAMGEDDDCHVIIKGVWTDGDFKPVADKKVKIEFIGDSITSGEGTYGANEDTDWLAMYMSSSRTYATMLAKTLDADIHIISQGGWGVLSSWCNEPQNNIPRIYEKVCGLATGSFNEKFGTLKDYDFKSWQPDAIVVNLGTNDASAFNQPEYTNPVTGEKFKQRKNADGSFNKDDIERFKVAVVNFMKMLRKNNPKSHILWVYGMLGYDLCLPITEAIARYQAETGDSNVQFITLPDTTFKTVGAHSHPGYEAHKTAYEVLKKYLGDKLGLEVKDKYCNP